MKPTHIAFAYTRDAMVHSSSVRNDVPYVLRTLLYVSPVAGWGGNGRFPDNHFPGQTFPGQFV